MGSGHIKVKKGTHHLFYMAIPCHSIESHDIEWCGNIPLVLIQLGLSACKLLNYIKCQTGLGRKLLHFIGLFIKVYPARSLAVNQSGQKGGLYYYWWILKRNVYMHIRTEFSFVGPDHTCMSIYHIVLEHYIFVPHIMLYITWWFLVLSDHELGALYDMYCMLIFK